MTRGLKLRGPDAAGAAVLEVASAGRLCSPSVTKLVPPADLSGGRGEKLQPTQKLKAILANPTIRRFLIHYFAL